MLEFLSVVLVSWCLPKVKGYVEPRAGCAIGLEMEEKKKYAVDFHVYLCQVLCASLHLQSSLPLHNSPCQQRIFQFLYWVLHTLKKFACLSFTHWFIHFILQSTFMIIYSISFFIDQHIKLCRFILWISSLKCAFAAEFMFGAWSNK